MPVHAGTTWSAKYAVDCPEPCDSNACKSTLRCKRTVLDDCGCCRVCAAALGETCYRTVSGMDGVKCGPGLKCQFYTEEDDFGDEFGICKGNNIHFACTHCGNLTATYLHMELASCLRGLKCDFSSSALSHEESEKYLLVLKDVTCRWDRVISVRILFRLGDMCKEIRVGCARSWDFWLGLGKPRH